VDDEAIIAHAQQFPPDTSRLLGPNTPGAWEALSNDVVDEIGDLAFGGFPRRRQLDRDGKHSWTTRDIGPCNRVETLSIRSDPRALNENPALDEIRGSFWCRPVIRHRFDAGVT
jgi:hypothetical protein